MIGSKLHVKTITYSKHVQLHQYFLKASLFQSKELTASPTADWSHRMTAGRRNLDRERSAISSVPEPNNLARAHKL